MLNGVAHIRLLTRAGPSAMAQAQLINFASEAEALTEIWERLRANNLEEWPQLVDLTLVRADGAEMGLQELQAWAALSG